VKKPFMKFASTLPCCAFVLMMFSCFGQEPGFQGGIRIRATTGTIEDPFDVFRVQGAIDSGNLVAAHGGGSGTQTFWTDGSTDSSGIDDHPNAVTDADWTTTVSFVVAVPECGVDTAPDYVGPNGKIIEHFCVQ
jgi:hypothetical protein